MDTVKGVGLHPVDLSDGRVVGPGDVVTDVPTSNPHNKALVDDGFIAVVNDGTDAPKGEELPEVDDAPAAPKERKGR